EPGSIDLVCQELRTRCESLCRSQPDCTARRRAIRHLGNSGRLGTDLDIQDWRGKPMKSEASEPRIDYRKVAPEAVQALWTVERYARESKIERFLLELVKLRAPIMNGGAY